MTSARQKIIAFLFLTMISKGMHTVFAASPPENGGLLILLGESMPSAASNPARGFSYDFMKSVQNALGVSDEILIAPWSRVQSLYRNTQRPVMIMNVSRTPAREKDYRWVIPLYSTYSRFVSLGDIQHTLETARNLKVGVISNMPYKQYLESRGFKNLLALSAPPCSLFPLLKRKRTDVIFVSNLQAQSCLQNVPASLYTLSDPVHVIDVYLVSNMITPDTTLDTYRNEIDKQIKAGIFQKFQQKYDAYHAE